MTRNPYQRIPHLKQAGHIDTLAKFKQLTAGINLKGLRVLDVGCNLGMMTDLARRAGASKAVGVDTNRDMIEEANRLFPHCKFQIQAADWITGHYDIIIMSAVFHYFADPERVLNQAARCLSPNGILTMDAWLDPGDACVRAWYKDRSKWIPTSSAFMMMVKRCFDVLEIKGPALSPDNSKRFLYQLSSPKPNPPARAVLIYGRGGTGKTTLATSYKYHHLQIDSIFQTWRRVEPLKMMSVRWTADAVHGNELERHLDFFMSRVDKWLYSRRCQDVVIEGYDLLYDDFRKRALELLQKHGWGDVEQIHLTETRGTE